MPIRSRIRTIPNYPKPGIQFRDITTLFQDAEGLKHSTEEMVKAYREVAIDKVAGIEARGFIVGGTVAHQLGCGFVPVRKQGKLPWKTFGRDYELEYGTDRVEIHIDAISPGERVLLVDDLIATGGTAEAAAQLVEEAQGVIVGCCFIIDLPDLGGSQKLEALGYQVMSLCHYSGE